MTTHIEVTAAIMRRGERVFAARRAPGRHLAGFWEFPGGKVEQGETYHQCLSRELKEEFGIVVSVGEFFGESIFDYGEKHIRLLAYETEHISGEFELTDHDEVCWIKRSELAELCWAPADVPFVEILLGQNIE